MGEEMPTVLTGSAPVSSKAENSPERKKALRMEEKPIAARETQPRLHPNESAQLGIGRNHLTFKEFIEVFCKRI